MADYAWSDENLGLIRDQTLSVHRKLVEANNQMKLLMQTMKGDPEWGGEHRDTFLAWMDLLGQFHEGMADGGVGHAAHTVLGEAVGRWDGYDANSNAIALLNEVQ